MRLRRLTRPHPSFAALRRPLVTSRVRPRQLPDHAGLLARVPFAYRRVS